MSYNKKEVNSVSINDEGNLFAVSLESGIRIFNMEPLVGKLALDSSLIGSISMCKLLHRTNLIALVGGGNSAKYADNTVLIWDALGKEFVLEFTFASKVISLSTRRDRLFVVERDRIHCFTFPHNPFKLFTIETRNNPQGICEVTPLTSAAEMQLLAYPGHREGSVQLLDLSSTFPPISVAPAADVQSQDQLSSSERFIDSDDPGASVSISPTSVLAHQSEIACLALNRTGTLLATASRKGTLIRIFKTVDQANCGNIKSDNPRAYIPLAPSNIMEFRRGMDTATVYCIVFSPDSEYVLASSDKGTVHIFALKEPRLNRMSTFSSVGSVVPNLGLTITAAYSLAKFTLPAECACVCAFGADRKSVYAVCEDGTYHKYLFGTDGTCERDNFDTYLDVPDEADHLLL